MRKPYLLISGATGGLGSAFAVECAQRGYDLVLTDVPKEAAQFTAALASAFSVDVHYFSCDLTSPQERMTLYKTLDEEGFSFWGLSMLPALIMKGHSLAGEETKSAKSCD
jgi:short-subunit dehydrogenase